MCGIYQNPEFTTGREGVAHFSSRYVYKTVILTPLEASETKFFKVFSWGAGLHLHSNFQPEYCKTALPYI